MTPSSQAGRTWNLFAHIRPTSNKFQLIITDLLITL